MDITRYIKNEGEKPLDRVISDGGFCCVFRTLACVGDSLSSGELESLDEEGKKGYHDYFEYSWLQFLARSAGIGKAYNFTRGGMTAKEYVETFAENKGFWNPELACQGYIIALGVNDLKHIEIGSVEDINLEDYTKNAKTFAGYYGAIIQRYKQIQPKSRFFLMTIPDKRDVSAEHAKLLHEIAKLFEYTYVVDLYKYAPDYNEQLRKNFFLAGHMNVMGYKFTADMVGSYIDYIIRNNMEDFKQIGFVGTDFHNCAEKW